MSYKNIFSPFSHASSWKDCCKLQLKDTERDKETQEAAGSLATANDISMDAAVAVVETELDCFFFFFFTKGDFASL